MNDYNKYDFFSFIDEVTDQRRFFIKIHKEMVEVDKDVYYVCYNSYRKQIRDNKRDEAQQLISYDVTYEDGYSLLDKIGKINDEISYDVGLLEDVVEAVNNLKEEDRIFITELLVKEKKEKELAEKYHVRQQAINKRKKSIIKKIQKKMKNGC